MLFRCLIRTNKRVYIYLLFVMERRQTSRWYSLFRKIFENGFISFSCERKNPRVKSYYFFVVINVRGEEYNRRSFATSFKVDCYAYVDINSSKKKKEKFKEREYNIEIFIVKKKCIPQNGNLFFLYQLLIFIILYPFFERVNSKFKRTQNKSGTRIYFIRFLFLP